MLVNKYTGLDPRTVDPLRHDVDSIYWVVIKRRTYLKYHIESREFIKIEIISYIIIKLD
jgi:hypothetical protein